MQPSEQVPMIWTTHGNLPTEILDYHVEWAENAEEVIMSEIYELKGDVVRKSVHIHKKQGAAMGSEQASFA